MGWEIFRKIFVEFFFADVAEIVFFLLTECSINRKNTLLLSYNEACLKANLPKLSEGRDMLSQNLFDNITRNKDHKLAHLLPPKTAHTKKLRTFRAFQKPTCRTDRFKNSFVIHYSDK